MEMGITIWVSSKVGNFSVSSETVSFSRLFVFLELVT
jgi:hypothetical protein